MSALLAALGVWLAAAVVYRLLAFRAIDRHLHDPGDGDASVPPSGEVLVVRPLRGAPSQLGACLESLWRAAERAGARVTLAVADRADPALPLVEKALADGSRPPTDVRIDPGPPGLNRKMANLIQATGGSQAEFLLFSDADVRVPENYVGRAVRPFKDSDVGLTTFPYHSVPGRSLASRIDALITNTHFLPSLAAALSLQGLHFGLGASIAVRSEALRKAGGLEALMQVNGDDYWMGRNIEDAGYRLAFVPMMLEHRLEDEGWRASASRHLRWASVVREQRPPGYLGQAVTYGAVPALSLAIIGALAGASAALWLAPAAWWAFDLAGLWRRRRTLGLRRRDLALVPLSDLSVFGIWLGGFFGRARPS